jgi:hypothetical protein
MNGQEKNPPNILGFRRTIALAAVFAAGGAAVLIYLVNPTETKLYPACVFHAITGYHCPGCGCARALHQLLHGNIGVAFRYNPLAVLLLPFVSYGLVSAWLRETGFKPLPTLFVPAFWIWILLAVVLLFWGLRNIPVYPFSLLAPP